MRRIYEAVLAYHLKHYRQMLFLAGPRQVGKTTISKHFEKKYAKAHYLNWDVEEHRAHILSGALELGKMFDLDEIQQKKPLIIFDEIHKQPMWKNALKGFFDLYGKKADIMVTGSAQLDIYQAGNDSMMGRYFSYQIHPLSVAELLHIALPDDELRPQVKINQNDFEALWTFGGFPEPFTKRNKMHYLRWKKMRNKQLLQEDIRDLTQIHEISQLEVLTALLRHQTGGITNRHALANKVDVSVPTISRWLTLLERVYYCFRITPWHKNVSRSLIKEPKLYLWDWSLLDDIGARAENFVASHLNKAVAMWNDRGLGEYSLHFLRDKEKNEVDFLVVKNNEPWFLVEVKHGQNHRLSPQLARYQKMLNAPHAFQVVIDMPFVDANCFDYTRPVIVPATTFLSQLV